MYLEQPRPLLTMVTINGSHRCPFGYDWLLSSNISMLVCSIGSSGSCRSSRCSISSGKLGLIISTTWGTIDGVIDRPRTPTYAIANTRTADCKDLTRSTSDCVCGGDTRVCIYIYIYVCVCAVMKTNLPSIRGEWAFCLRPLLWALDGHR